MDGQSWMQDGADPGSEAGAATTLRACPACGVDTPVSSRWCGRCGERLIEAPSDQVDTPASSDPRVDARPLLSATPVVVLPDSTRRWAVGGLLVAAVVGGLLLAPAADDAVAIYGDGDIHCPTHLASDDSLRAGTVAFEPGDGEVRVIITLTDAAPDSRYSVELWNDESCGDVYGPVGDGRDRSFSTDADGAGVFDHVFTVEPGTHRLTVNLVTPDGDPEDPRHREMGAAMFTEVVVGPEARG